MVNVDVISTDFNDIVVFDIRGSDCTVAAIYLPPIESKFYSNDYFDTLDLICETFAHKKQFYLVGDFNSRIGTPMSSSMQYQPNPDTGTNNHGKHLLDIIQKHNLHVINGSTCDHLTCDSAFTYFKANKKSQIDLALCNTVGNIQSFTITEKNPSSDHCPVALSIEINIRPSMFLIRECARSSLNYDHNDITKRLPSPINIKRINAPKLIAEFEKLATHLNENYNPNDVDTFANELGLYNACKTSQTERKKVIPAPNTNCTSKHIHAISAAHYNLYIWKINNNAPTEEINETARTWWDYNCLALEMEKKEYNTKVNKKWAHCKKNDPRQMWKMIDWKGKSQTLPSAGLEPTCVQNYFKDIFQSEKTLNHPTIADIQEEITAYTSVNHPMDTSITMEEIDNVLCNVGNGTGIDGIPPVVANLLPKSLREVLQIFLQIIFQQGPYPKSWTTQLLFPTEKKDTQS